MSINLPKYAGDMVAPSDIIARLWKEVLQLPDLPAPRDNFFALGGDSMSMVMLGFRINEELGIDVPDDAVLGAQTLDELSNLVDGQLKLKREMGPQTENNASTMGFAE